MTFLFLTFQCAFRNTAGFFIWLLIGEIVGCKMRVSRFADRDFLLWTSIFFMMVLEKVLTVAPSTTIHVCGSLPG